MLSGRSTCTHHTGAHIMRFKQQTLPPALSPGQTRIRRQFLFLPKCIDRETRWLKHARWIAQCMPIPSSVHPPHCYLDWRPTKWID